MHANGFAISAKEKKSRRLLLLKRSVPLYLLILPSLILLIVFTYIPMYGVTIAFKDYKTGLGIFGSEWVGFKIEGQNLCKFERADGGYDVYFDLKALAAEKGVSEEKFIGNDLKLFFEIGVGFGAEKSVTFDGIALVDAVPAN